MTRRAALLLVFLSLLAPPGGSAQEPTVHEEYLVQRWGVDDGLPVRHITDAAREPGGYLWLTTSDGLVRFDGLRFTVSDVSNTPGLPTNRLRFITVASDGALWVQSASSALRFHGGRVEDVTLRTAPIASSEPMLAVGDSVFIPTTRGLWVWREGQVRRVRPDGLATPVEDLILTRNGAQWIVADGGVTRMGGGGPNRTLPGIMPEVTPPILDPLYEDDTGGVWLATHAGVRRFDGRSFAPIEGIAGAVRQIGRGPGGETWAHDATAWWAYRDGRMERLLPIQRESPDTVLPLVSAPDGSVWWHDGRWLYRNEEPILASPYRFGDRIVPEPTGGAWLFGQELVRIRSRTVTMISENDGLPGRLVYPVLQTRDGAIWTGLWDGDRSLVRLHAGGVDEVVSGHIISALHQSRDGTIWVGLLSRIAILREGRLVGVSFPDAASETMEGDINVIHEDRRGRVWVGGGRGIVVGRPGEGADRRWTSVPIGHTALAVVETEAGEILIGSRGAGLGRHLERGRFEWLGSAQGLASDNVRDVYEDKRGVLWIATEDRGLCRLDRAGARSLLGGDLACFGTGEGIYDLSLHRILPDDDGRLWISSNRGIFWIGRDQADAVASGEAAMLSPIAYTEHDGMRSREANGARQPAGIRAADGRLYFPTQDGIAVIDPETVRRPAPPPSRIEGATVGDEAVSPTAIASGRVTMAPGVQDLTVRYTGISFEAPESVRYRVQLAGYDDGWRSGSARSGRTRPRRGPR